MSWIYITVISFSLLAVGTIIDKYLLKSGIPNPRFFAFSVGVLGGGVVVLIPFGVVTIPILSVLGIAFFGGAMRVFGLLALFSGLKKFEASRIIPAIGGMAPVFTLLLTALFIGNIGQITPLQALAFVLLVAGSVVVSVERGAMVSFQSLAYSAVAALLFSSFFFFSKIVYNQVPFMTGLFWLSMGGVLGALFMLAFSDVRKNISSLVSPKKKKVKIAIGLTLIIFFVGQVIGATAIVLQNVAIALVPFEQLAFINALGGVQYVVLFVLVIIFSLFFPSIVKERITPRVLLQKSMAILLIGAGLGILAF